MPQTQGESAPGIVAIGSVTSAGRLSLKKEVRQHLGVDRGAAVWVDASDQVLLGRTGVRVEPDARGGIALPEDARARLGTTGKTHLAFVQRGDSLALKRFEVEQADGTCGRLYDVETDTTVIRRTETSQMPDELIPAATDRLRGTLLRSSPRGWLAGRPTFEAWVCRRLRRWADADDERVRRDLVDERTGRQSPDGSWDGDVSLTSRNLRELAGLGLTHSDRPMASGAKWLLAREESRHNPGMWFLHDELVDVQRRIRDEADRMDRDKERGTRPRFREIKRSEQSLVAAGDALIRRPCGPRIMWPNALAVEALVAAGYEDSDRV